MNKLHDLDFANNIPLVASRIGDMQPKVENLNINKERKEENGLKINHGKTVVMKERTSTGEK